MTAKLRVVQIAALLHQMNSLKGSFDALAFNLSDRNVVSSLALVCPTPSIVWSFHVVTIEWFFVNVNLSTRPGKTQEV